LQRFGSGLPKDFSCSLIASYSTTCSIAANRSIHLLFNSSGPRHPSPHAISCSEPKALTICTVQEERILALELRAIESRRSAAALLADRQPPNPTAYGGPIGAPVRAAAREVVARKGAMFARRDFMPARLRKFRTVQVAPLNPPRSRHAAERGISAPAPPANTSARLLHEPSIARQPAVHR
jgi:hypothetical protein